MSFLFCSQIQSAPNAFDPVTLDCLKKPYTLGKAIPDGALHAHPRAPFEKLYLLNGSSKREIHDLSDLTGVVAIRNPSNALAFVRLRTNLDSFYLWGQPHILEIHATPRGPFSEGFAGAVWGKNVSRFVRQFPKFKKLHKDYQVTRLVLVQDTLMKAHAEEIVEQLGPDGQYVVVRSFKDGLPKMLTSINWHFLVF
jgi:hypothetical protein